jgi:formate dehydrogenase
MNITIRRRTGGNGPPRGRKPRRTPRGRQIDPQRPAEDRRASSAGHSRQRDLLIEHLLLIQDKYGTSPAAHIAALAPR